jgi:hypothetical protein
MTSEQRKAVIKNADMVESMQQDAVDIASKALSEYNIEKVRWRCARRGAVPIVSSSLECRGSRGSYFARMSPHT